MIVENVLMLRVIFADVHTQLRHRKSYKWDKRPGGWIRVRKGDVDSEGNKINALTYKTVEKSDAGDVERVIDVAIDGFDKCVELLQEAGLPLKSRQESKRTKFICEHLGCHYIINIDIWPWLDDVAFVSVNPKEGISTEEMDDLCSRIGLNNVK